VIAGSGIGLKAPEMDGRGHQSFTANRGPQSSSHPDPSHGIPVQSYSEMCGRNTFALSMNLSTTRQEPDERSTWNLNPSRLSTPNKTYVSVRGVHVRTA
jgi:hypothetical protein